MNETADERNPHQDRSDAPKGHDISSYPPAAQRAFAEAQARKAAETPAELPVELGGRDGPEPVRYGDWEKKGIAVDF